MAVTRSPGYPAISISEAIGHIKKIFAAEHRAPMSPEVAVKHIGYGGLNGASLRVISSLKKFGLLDGRGENLVVTDDAITIIADEQSEDQTERVEAINRALLSSDLFAELHERFAGKSSEQNITAYLTKNNFKPDAAKTAAKMYLDSVRFVEEASKGYNKSPADEDENNSGGGAPDEKKTDPGVRGQIKPVIGMKQETFTLDTGDVTIQWPTSMTQDSFQDFSDWLDILKRKIKRGVGSEQDQQKPSE